MTRPATVTIPITMRSLSNVKISKSWTNSDLTTKSTPTRRINTRQMKTSPESRPGKEWPPYKRLGSTYKLHGMDRKSLGIDRKTHHIVNQHKGDKQHQKDEYSQNQ